MYHGRTRFRPRRDGAFRVAASICGVRTSSSPRPTASAASGAAHDQVSSPMRLTVYL